VRVFGGREKRKKKRGGPNFFIVRKLGKGKKGEGGGF